MPAFQAYDERTTEKVDGGTTMKTPDEIKKGLECCISSDCGDEKCPYLSIQYRCFEEVMRDALALIRQLEAHNAELERELGKAVMALTTCAMDGLDGNICNYCTHKNCDEQDLHFECFEWRGLCEENSKNTEPQES